MKTVQVLVSTYNGEKYIRQQIDSILSQKNVNIRILVRDDGSNDNTISILKDYESKGALKLIIGNNLGPSRSFLTLVDLCEQADYYAFSDQDDVWIEDKVITAIKMIEENKADIPLLYCSALQRVDEMLNPINVQIFRGLKTNIYSALVRERLAGCTFLFNNKLFELVQGSSKLELNYSHDSWVLLICYACGGKVIFDDKPHILFRRYGTNVSVDGGNLRKRVAHELRYFGKYKNQRYNAVKVLMKFRYKDIVHKEFLNKVINYKDSVMDNLALAFDTRMDCGITIANLINRIVILNRCF